MSHRAESLIHLLDELARTRGRTQVAFDSIRLSADLTEVESIVLSAVTHADRAPTVPQIGRSLGHPRQVIQRAADSLHERGLLEWRDNPDHKRARLLVASPAGADLAHANDAEGLRLAHELTDGMDAARIEAVVEGLREIRTIMNQNLRALRVKEDEGETA